MKDFLLGVFYNIVSYNNFEFFPNNSFQFSIFLSLTYTLALLKPSYGLDYLKLNISLEYCLIVYLNKACHIQLCLFTSYTRGLDIKQPTSIGGS